MKHVCFMIFINCWQSIEANWYYGKNPVVNTTKINEIGFTRKYYFSLSISLLIQCVTC